MKYIIYMLLGISLLAGCGKKDDPQEDGLTPIPEDILEISPEGISCGNVGGEFTVKVKSSGRWDITDTLSWVDVSITDGAGAKVTVTPNQAQERNGKIVFNAGKLHKELTIEQASSDSFTIDCNSKSFNHNGGSFTVVVTSYSAWKVECNSDWIETDIKSESCPKAVKVTVQAHQGRTDRQGALVFIRNTDTLCVSISQEAAPFIELSTGSVIADGDGGTFDILFLTNTKVDITCSHDWIRLIRLSSGNKVSFEVLRNMSDAREGSITISATSNSMVSKTLIIKQEAKIPHPSLSLSEGSSMTVTDNNGFTLHPVFVDMTDTEIIWSSSSEDIADVDNGGNVTIHKTGTCTIKAVNRYHGLEVSITLNIKLKAQGISIMFGNQDVVAVPYSSRFAGEQIPIEVTLTPSYAYSEDIIYFSTDQEVAELKDNILHCLKPGKTEIFIESAFNNFHYKFTVFVIDVDNR